jgi:holo-[acyl-carrier-protein] synthase
MKEPSAGIDIVEVARFVPFVEDREHAFLKKVFTDEEVAYAFSHVNPAVRLAGMFAAKEAVSKALGVREFPFAEVEIRHTEEGKPEAYKDASMLPVSVSIAHTDTLATAVAMA